MYRERNGSVEGAGKIKLKRTVHTQGDKRWSSKLFHLEPVLSFYWRRHEVASNLIGYL